MGSARLSYRELYQLKWCLGSLLAVVALSGVTPLGIVPRELLGLAAAGILCVIGFPGLKMRLPQVRWLWVTPVMVVIICADFVTSGADLLPPLIRMLALLTFVRAVQFRTRREDLQLLLLSLFLIITTGTLSLEMSFLVQIGLFAPLAMLLLLAINLSASFLAEPEIPAGVWSGFAWLPFLGRLRAQVDRVMGVFLLAVTWGAWALAAGLFVVLPRFKMAAALPMVEMHAPASLTGFSGQVELGDIVAIQEDHQVVLRVDMPQPPQEPLYFRMVALDRYTGRGFQQSPSAAAWQRIYDDFRFTAPTALAPSGSGPTWTFYLESGIARYLPLPGAFTQLRLARRERLERNAVLNQYALPEVPGSTFFFQLLDVEPTEAFPAAIEEEILLTPERLSRLDADEYPATLLQVPGDAASLDIVGRHLQAITGGADLPVAEFLPRAVAYLRANHRYALQTAIPPGDADVILRWLDSEAPGHCELFASAFCLLARAAGHPARLITGFADGDWNARENYLMVRGSHAHAWVEVLDPAQGWQRVDPTPGGGLPQVSEPASFAQVDGFAAFKDSLRLLWYRRIVNFDADQQRDLATGLGSSLGNGLRQAWTHTVRTMRHWTTAVGSVSGWISAVVVLVGLAALAYLYRRYRARPPAVWSVRATNVWRRRAGELLRRRGWDAALATDGGPEARAALQAIRFGPTESWPEPKRAFKDARRLLRRPEGRTKRGSAAP